MLTVCFYYSRHNSYRDYYFYADIYYCYFCSSKNYSKTIWTVLLFINIIKLVICARMESIYTRTLALSLALLSLSNEKKETRKKLVPLPMCRRRILQMAMLAVEPLATSALIL